MKDRWPKYLIIIELFLYVYKQIGEGWLKKKIFLPKLCIYFKTISCNEFVQGQRVGINNMKDRWTKICDRYWIISVRVQTNWWRMVKKKIFLPKLCIYFKTISCNEFVQGQRAGINNMKDRWPKYLTVIELFRCVYKQIGKMMVEKKIFLPKLCIYFKTISCNEFVQGQRVGINNMKDRWPKYLTVIELFLYVYKQIGEGWLKKKIFTKIMHIL